MDPYQFYPTPASLAERVWALVKKGNWARVLEPQAGNGDLALACPDWKREYGDRVPIDCCEINLEHHPTLRAKGLNVVGTDFLQFRNGHCYDVIIQNPPFSQGAKHVLHAWDIAWDCELVSIINASTIKNPHSEERKHLLRLIEQHGSVEFHVGSFATEEAERPTDVEVAVIYLRKRAPVAQELIGNLLSEMRTDAAKGESLSGDYDEAHELAIPNSVLENTVRAFNAAVKAMQDSVKADARASYYASLIGETMATRDGTEGGTRPDVSTKAVQRAMHAQYTVLKDRAWASVLRSVEVMDRLSQGAQRRLEASFADIMKMEFTNQNVQSFVLGIVHSQQELLIGMCCDVFDHIIRWHTEENGTLYKGWISNNKHRTAGMRIKTKRFILPGFKAEGWQRQLNWDQIKMLSDFDKTFAALDGGRLKPEVGLCDIFTTELEALRKGARVSSSYFECRWYPGIGTIHFYPRSPKLVDALNRMVGRHRKWLPPEGTRVPEDFWRQYEESETFDKEVREKLCKGLRSWTTTPLQQMNSSDSHDRVKAHETICTAIEQVLERHGINPDFALTQEQRPLLVA